jgi:hypothetical protein
MVPTVILEQHSRIFMLKLVIVAILTILPGWLYMQFIRFKGRSLYDEFVINLFRLRIDQECNLPAPPNTRATIPSGRPHMTSFWPIQRPSLRTTSIVGSLKLFMGEVRLVRPV